MFRCDVSLQLLGVGHHYCRLLSVEQSCGQRLLISHSSPLSHCLHVNLNTSVPLLPGLTRLLLLLLLLLISRNNLAAALSTDLTGVLSTVLRNVLNAALALSGGVAFNVVVAQE